MRTLDFDKLESLIPAGQRALLSGPSRPCAFPVFVHVGDLRVEYSVRTMQILALSFLRAIGDEDNVMIDNARENANIPPGSSL